MQQPRSAKIVVIDDHPEYLDYLSTLLRRAAYDVVAFGTASEALRSKVLDMASLVITDVFMPEMDGFEVLRVLQQTHPMLPLLAISGAAASKPGLVLECMPHLGARATFSKPIDAEQLLRAVAALIASAPESPS